MALTRAIARLSTDDRVSVVLAVDPDIAENNDAEALARYAETSDLSFLTIPDTATRITVRPLSRRELDACEDRANESPGARRSVSGARLLASAVQSKDASGLEFLDDEDVERINRHARYMEARALELCRAAMVDPDDEVAYVIEHSTAAAVELATHIERVSVLPKAQLSRSV